MRDTEALKSFFSLDEPLGPVRSVTPSKQESDETFKAYFHRDNFPFDQLQLNPTMIIGRKGAGKTDALLSYKFLNSERRQETGPIVFFKDEDAAVSINLVVGQISTAISESYPGPMVEQVAGFWSGLFQISIIAAIAYGEREESSEISLMRHYLRQYGITPDKTERPFEILLSVIQVLRREYESAQLRASGLGFFEALSIINPGPYNLEAAAFAASVWLRNKRKQSLILFDSVEYMAIDNQNDHLAISGLLKSIGDFNSKNNAIQFRCCIPSESYFYLTDISSNTVKDFSRVLILQWSASELICIAAKRMMKFLELWYVDDFKRYNDSFNVEERSGAIGFWKAILPDLVTNSIDGRSEGTLTYILRHTQLLPRQIIAILNGIVSCAVADRKAGRAYEFFPEIEPSMVVSQVAQAENNIRANIYNSYKLIWPQARSVLEDIIPRIGKNTISHSELHRIFNKSGVRKLMPRGYPDLVRLLSELGAIGRLSRTTDRFHIGIFEYSEPNRLIFSPSDILCVHPLFSSIYQRAGANSQQVEYKPVYPYGIDPDIEDLRASRSTLY